MRRIYALMLVGGVILAQYTHCFTNEHKSVFLKQYQSDKQKQSDSQFTRVVRTISCTDCDYIPKVPHAGLVLDYKEKKVQVMHNGILIYLHSYCEGDRWGGSWVTDIIQGLKGHHEPQEEKAFHEILKTLKPGAVMLELGCWWAYYSMWFKSSSSS